MILREATEAFVGKRAVSAARMSAASSAAQSVQPLAFTGSRSRPCYQSAMARNRATRIGCAGWSIRSAHRA
ncbi:MAG TPA: hypothetical protein VHF86_07315, partial [Xanthomonadaceae bacterium]|nr:hypothetical protein [Xanthomonadaceae bacterium]